MTKARILTVEEELRLAAMVFKNAMDGMMVTDAKGTILSVNNAFTKITGYASEEAIGKNPRILKSGRLDAEFYKNFWDTLITFRSKSGFLIVLIL